MLNRNFVEAVIDFDKAIELNPNDPALYNDRGFAKQKLKSDKEAISDFSKAIELNPKDARIFINRASAKYDLNDFDGAEADYKKALELDPHNSKVVELAQSGIDLANKARAK
jgi:Flp pilus assembly protein TadD